MNLLNRPILQQAMELLAIVFLETITYACNNLHQ